MVNGGISLDIKRRDVEFQARVLTPLRCARHATTLAELDAVTLEIDHLVTRAIRYARQQTTNMRAMSALILAIDAARAVVADHRRDPQDRRGSVRHLMRGVL